MCKIPESGLTYWGLSIDSLVPGTVLFGDRLVWHMRKRITDQYKTAGEVVMNVRRGFATSRRDLATMMELSPSTVGLYVDQMIRCGFLEESGREQGSMGRPKRTLVPRGNAGWFAGVEFYAGRLRAVRIDFSGKQIRTVERELGDGDGPEEVVTAISAVVEKLKGGGREPCFGVGVGAPGVVNPDSGIVGKYVFLRDWEDVPLARLLQSRLGLPVTLEGNLRVIALGERWFGGGRELSHYVILGPRKGFGVAVVHGGVLLSGVNHAAGEVGNWLWSMNEQSGELHGALAAPAVWRRVAGMSDDVPEPSNLAEALKALSSDQSGAAWELVRMDFAKLIGYLELLLDCGRYFVHGPLTELGTDFWKSVEKEILVAMPHLRGRPPVLQRSNLGESAGPLGAASLAMEKWVPTW